MHTHTFSLVHPANSARTPCSRHPPAPTWAYPTGIHSLLETVFSAQSYLPLTFPLSHCTESRTVRFMIAYQEGERGLKQRQDLRRGHPGTHPHRCPPETKGLTHMDKNLLPCCGTRKAPHIPSDRQSLRLCIIIILSSPHPFRL